MIRYDRRAGAVCGLGGGDRSLERGQALDRGAPGGKQVVNRDEPLPHAVVAEVPGRLTVNAPLRPVCPPMSTSALLVWLISMARSVLFWPVALTFTWNA